MKDVCEIIEEPDIKVIKDGGKISYDWSSTLPIQLPNAPYGWDAELTISNVNRCKIHANSFPLLIKVINLIIFVVFWNFNLAKKFSLFLFFSALAITACPLACFRECRHVLRCAILLNKLYTSPRT